MCFKKVHAGSLFCSEECEELHYSLVSIQIPIQWVKKHLKTAKNCKEAFIMAKDFAQKHNYNLSLVIKRLIRQYKIDICYEKED